MQENAHRAIQQFGGIGIVGIAGFCLMAVFLSGCGASQGPELGQVTGQVTLDGEPLPNADITFQPQQEGGSPSIASTDSEGRYTLQYTATKNGAMIGKHVVRITTARTEEDESGEDVAVSEKLPPKYHDNAEDNPAMIREVEPGDNTIDFELQSDE